MVFFQLNVTGLLFQSFRTASPIECKGIKILLMCKEKLMFFLLKPYELI